MKAVDLVRKFCGQNEEKYYIYENYSGRGASDKKCTGIVVRNGNSYIKMLVELTKFLDDNDFDDFNLEFEGMSVDKLGLDTIIYFPYMEG